MTKKSPLADELCYECELPDCMMYHAKCAVNINAIKGRENLERGDPVSELQAQCMRAYTNHGKKVA